MKYIYQQPAWPDFFWDERAVAPLLAKVRHAQGLLLGRMQALGFELQREALLEVYTLDVLRSTEIEGILLHVGQVRSSVARRLGMDAAGLPKPEREVEGVVEMTFDAVRNYAEPLDEARLYAWHRALFPEGKSGPYRILTGRWRDDSTGPMQVVSGAMGKERVHFQAPAAERIEEEMRVFLAWFNREQEGLDAVLKAALAHLWFITIHPFEDGNGRIARALTDMLLARADDSEQRFYSMSAEIGRRRKAYYTMLERTQKGDLDVTEWLLWFLDSLRAALDASEQTLGKVLAKYAFWHRHRTQSFNPRQQYMLERLLDDFYGKLTTSKWAKMTKCSQDTALRDIRDLLQRGILKKSEKGGRSTSYELVV